MYGFHTKWSRSADCVSETTLEAFPDLAIASMLIGNIMLLFPKLTMAGLWIMLRKVPYRFLYPAIVPFCCIAA